MEIYDWAQMKGHSIGIDSQSLLTCHSFAGQHIEGVDF